MDEKQKNLEPEKKDEDSLMEEYIHWRALNPENPLFLPEGSVRAIIIIYLLTMLFYFISHNLLIQDWIKDLTIMSVGFYFGGRTKK
jgi:hypothetical protein